MSHHAAPGNVILKHSLRELLRTPPLALAMLGIPGFALAGPTGENVVGGDANIIRPDATRTVINQLTDRAAINWQTFNVDADEYVIFNQPDVSSIALNRVLGGDASYILGHLQANGQVFLLNPAGVFFTHGATLDVQGLLGSTLDMNPDAFMAGDFALTRNAASPANTQVINNGNITAGPGGYVVLAGDYAENTGIITASAGSIALVSGNALTLDIQGDGLVNFAVNEATLSDAAGVRNAGSLIADGGRVIMTAKVASDLVATAVNNEGLVRARSVEERDGEIYLVGFGGDVANSGTLDADGENADGGGIAVYSDRDVTLADGGVQTAAGGANHEGGFMRFVAEDHLDYQQYNIIRATGGISGGFVEVSGHGGISLLGIPQIGPGGQLLIDPQWMAIRNDADNVPVYYDDASSYNPINLLGALPSYVGSTDSLTAVNTTWISNQLQTGVDVTLVAEQGMFIDTVTTPMTIFDSTGGGNLTIGIGYANWSSGTSIAAADGGGDDGTQYFGGAFNGAPMPTITWLPGGQINLGALDFNILGDLTVRADSGTIALGEITANDINVSTGIGVGQIDIASGFSGSLNAVNNITITGNSIVTGYISNAFNVTINGDVGGTNFFVGSSASPGNVDFLTVNGDVNVTGGIWLNVGSGSINLNGSVTAGSNISFLASPSSSAPGNITAGFTSAGGTITVTARGPGAGGTGGNISFGSGLSASGDIILSAYAAPSGGGGNIQVTGNAIAGGRLQLLASGSNALSGGEINVTGMLQGSNADLVARGGSSSGGNINVGDITASNNVTIDGIHGSLHTIGNITADGINAHFSPLASGGVNVTMGLLHATGTSQGRDVDVVINGIGTGSTGNLDLAGATADNGHVYLDVFSTLTGSGSGNISVTGAMAAQDYIDVRALNNVTTQSLTVNNDTGEGRVEIVSGQNGSGDIDVNGNITVNGRAGSNNPRAASVRLDAGFGNSNNIRVAGTINVSGAGAAYTALATDSGAAASNGTLGVAGVKVFTQSGNVNLGNVNVDAVGDGYVDVRAVHTTAGDVTLNVADGNFTRSSTLSVCGSASCSIARTETLHDGGHGGVLLEGAGSGALAFGNVMITAGDGHLDARGFVDITGGGIKVTATGNDFEVSSSGTLDSQLIDYVERDIGGGATVRLETAAPGGVVSLTGAVSLAAPGNAELTVTADTIKLRNVGVTASAGTFVRSGTPVDGENDDGPFSGGDGGGPRINEGTMTGGAARVSLSGYSASPSFGRVSATTVNVNGAITIAGAGQARLEVDGDAVTISGDIGVSATHMQQDGTFADTYLDSGSTLVTESGTVLSSWGAARVDITGSGDIRLANVSIKGPTAGGQIEGVNVHVSAVDMTAVGGTVQVEETRTVGSDVEVLEIDGPNTLTGLGLFADNALELTGNLTVNAIGAGGTILSGNTIRTRDITINVTGGDYTVLAEPFGAAPVDFTVGNALLGFEGATAQVNGDVTLHADGQAHFGGDAVVSGNFSIDAGTGIRPTIPDTVQFLNALESDDEDATIALPASFGVQASAIRLATASGPLQVNGAVLEATGALVLSTGGSLSVSGTTVKGTTVEMTAGGNIVNAGANGVINAGALAISAGGNVNLANTAITVGAKNIATVTGDAAFLRLVALEGLATPTSGPNLFVSGRNVTLGDLRVAGDYVFLQANTLTVDGSISTSDPDLLLQVTPLAQGATFSLEQSAPGGGDTAYVHDDQLAAFNAATLVLGTTTHTGDAGIGQDSGTVDIGDTNLFVLTRGNVRGLDRVLSSGVVKDLATLVLVNRFEVPQTDEIDIEQDFVQNLRDRYALERRGDDEDDETGDEEGEDTDTDTDVEDREDSLISRDTVEEELMCQ